MSASLAQRAIGGLAVLVGSTVVSLSLTALLATMASAFGWCCVHSWALAHGTGVAVVLLFGLVGYHLSRQIAVRFRLLEAFESFGYLAHAGYLSAALGTLFWTQHFMWLGLVLSGCAVAYWLWRGYRPHFWLAAVGLGVSGLSVAHWLYLQWLFANHSSAIG